MAETEELDGFTFEKLGDGWQVTGYLGSGPNVRIPSQINGEPVTMVKSKAFEDNFDLVSVVLPDSITFIGTYAFWGCKSLESVVLPAGIAYIGLGTFMGCTALTSVYIPDSVTSIGDGAFRSCSSLVSLIIPPSVQIIGDSAFRNCTALASVELPDSVTRIDRSAYRFCDSLASVIMTTSVDYIGPRAFQDCPLLDSVTIIGDDMDATLTAFGNHSFYYLVADYVIDRNLISFDEAKRMLASSKYPGVRLLGARVIARYPDLAGDVPSKLTLLKLLSQAGRTSELRALEGVKGYFLKGYLLSCVDVASKAGRTETLAFLMQKIAEIDAEKARSAKDAPQGIVSGFSSGLEL